MLIISFVIFVLLKMIVLIGSANSKQIQFFGGSHKTITYIFTYLYSVWRSMSDLYLVLRTKYTVYAVTEQIYS